MILDNMNYEKVGAFIAERRKEKGMTQLQLAELLGVTDRAVSKWELAKSFPDVSLLKPLCEALDISVGELLEGELKPQEALSKQEADEAVIKGIRAYMAKLRGKQMRSRLITVIVLLILSACAYLWHVANQPIDFVKGDFDITKIDAQFDNGETCSFSLEGEVGKEIEEKTKAILADSQENRMPVNQLKVYEEPFITLEGIGTFYPSGYFDEKSKKNYSYHEYYFHVFHDFLKNRAADLDYQYRGKTQMTLGKSRLNLKCTLTEKPQELILSDYKRYLKESQRLHEEWGVPDAYVEKLDILSIERTDIQSLEATSYEEIFQKEIDYYDLYDYRIYKVVCDVSYTEALKNLGPQFPGGRRKEYFLVGERSAIGEGYKIFHQSVPMGI